MWSGCVSSSRSNGKHPSRWPFTSLSTNSTHKHERVRRWVDRQRIHCHFTPTGSSWLNLVERFFADLTSDVIRDGSFRSVPELVRAIESYLADRNADSTLHTTKGEAILAKIQRAKEALANDPFQCQDTRKRNLLSGRVVPAAGVPPAQDLAGSWRLASQGWSVHPPTDAGAAPSSMRAGRPRSQGETHG